MNIDIAHFCSDVEINTGQQKKYMKIFSVLQIFVFFYFEMIQNILDDIFYKNSPFLEIIRLTYIIWIFWAFSEMNVPQKTFSVNAVCY